MKHQGPSFTSPHGKAHPRAVPVTASQLFWGVCAAAGLASVGLASAHVSDGATFGREVTGSWSAITVSLDLLLLGVPCVAFAVIESRRLGMRWPWIWVPLALPLPGAFLVPLFFLLRERNILRQEVPTRAAHRVP